MSTPLRLAVIVLWLLACGQAHAGCDPTDNDIAEANRVISRIAALEDRLVRELRLQTAQLSGYVAQGARATVDGLGSHARARAQTAREEAQARSALEHAPGVTGCQGASGLAGFGSADVAIRQLGQSANRQETGRIAGDPDVLGYPAAADASVRARRVQSLYAPGAARPHADLRPDSLFGTTRLGSREDQAAALDLARNLVAPVARPAPPEPRTPGDRERLLRRRAADARVGLASGWMNRMIAHRVPSVALGSWAGEIAPDIARGGAALSERELLHILAVARPAAPDYQAGLSALSEAELLREIIRNQTLALRIAMQRLELAEMHGAIDAALLATLAGSRSGDR